MKHTPKKLLTALLALMLLLTPAFALAEQTPAADPAESYMVTMTIDKIAGTMNGQNAELPLTVRLSMGGDLKSTRGFAMVGVNDLTMMGSVEGGEVRAVVSGLDTGIAMPLDGAIEWAVSNSLLLGMDYNEVSEELRAAADEYLALLFESLSEVQEDPTGELLEMLHPRSSWQAEYDAYPSLLHAEPAGEEEITLFGQTCTAKKYTYSFDRLTEEEYDEFYKDYDAFYSAQEDGFSEEQQAAYDRMMELAEAEYKEKNGSSEPPVEAWKDDGSLSEWNGEADGSLSEWSEAEDYEIFYSCSGVIWQVDELLATVDESTFIWHMPDGDQTETSYYADMLTDTSVRIDETTDFTCSHCDLRESTVSNTMITVTETGMETREYLHTDYSDEDYSFSSVSDMHAVYDDHGVTADMKAETDIQMDGYNGGSELTEMHLDLAFTPKDGSDTYGTLSGPVTLKASAAGQLIDGGANLTIDVLPMPEGELLRLPPDTINLLDASEESLSALLSDIEKQLIKSLGSLIPGPQTPPSVGGALLG